MTHAEGSEDQVVTGAPPSLVIANREYRLLEKLGEGSLGSTWKARVLDRDGMFAVKVIALDDAISEDVTERLQRFVGMVSGSLGVVELREFLLERERSTRLYLVHPFVGGGNLHEWFGKNRRPGADSLRVADVLLGIVHGLVATEARGFHHHNLKPTNVLLSMSGEVMLTDFDLGYPHGATRRKGPYADPYLLPGSGQDIYAFGVLAFQILLGDFTREPSESETADALERGGVEGPLSEVVQRCLAEGLLRYLNLRDLERNLVRAIGRPPTHTASTHRAVTLSYAARSVPAVSKDGATEASRASASVESSRVLARPRVDEDVQVSVYRPKAVAPGVWHKLVAFVHLAEKRPDDPKEDPDPFEEVERRARNALRDEKAEYRGVTQDAMAGLPEGGVVTLALEGPGLEFNPPSRAFEWRESVHEETFRFRAAGSLEGGTVRGRLLAYVGPLLLAQVQLSFRVDARATSDADDTKLDRARAYRKIFASYAHADSNVVARFDEFARALGDRYLIDVRDLRAGEVWSEKLERLIAEADVFQLFWSRQSMHSKFCRREWEYALGLNKDDFVRPVYWDHPMPRDDERGLPPEELARLHFGRLGSALGSAPTPVEESVLLNLAAIERKKIEAEEAARNAAKAMERAHEQQLSSQRSSRRPRAMALMGAALIAASAAIAVVWSRRRDDFAEQARAALVEQQRRNAESARVNRALQKAKEEQEALRNALASAKDDMARAEIEAMLAQAKARTEGLEKAHASGAGKPKDSAKACNCPPGDPLCSCL